jgi:acyl-CoA reductase-like NAD-dependent aldehyde dehydrogenase
MQKSSDALAPVPPHVPRKLVRDFGFFTPSGVDALAKANDSRFGLGAYVHTNDLKRAHRMAAGLQAGRGRVQWHVTHEHQPAPLADSNKAASGARADAPDSMNSCRSSSS